MKIAILAGDVLKKETALKPVPADVEFMWLHDVHEFGTCADAHALFDLEFDTDPSRIEILRNFSGGPVFINDVTHSLAETDRRFIRVNGWPTFWQRPLCEAAVCDELQKTEAARILNAMKWDYRFVPDLPGFITARVVAAIINEAYFTLDAGVSVKAEIDIAMKLGTNYPFGPFEWSERIGLQKIHELLSVLGKKSDRYQVARGLEEAVMGKHE